MRASPFFAVDFYTGRRGDEAFGTKHLKQSAFNGMLETKRLKQSAFNETFGTKCLEQSAFNGMLETKFLKQNSWQQRFEYSAKHSTEYSNIER